MYMFKYTDTACMYKNVQKCTKCMVLRIVNFNNIMPTQTHAHQVEASRNHRDVEVFFVQVR